MGCYCVAKSEHCRSLFCLFAIFVPENSNLMSNKRFFESGKTQKSVDSTSVTLKKTSYRSKIKQFFRAIVR